MFKNVRTMAIAIALSAAALFSAAGTAAALSYYTSCFGFENPEHEYLVKDTVSGQISAASAATANLRSVHACTWTLGQPGRSYVFPLNLEGGGAGRIIAQVGWGNLSEGSGLHWYLTPNDNSSNVFTPSSWPAPVAGHSYTFNMTADICNGTGHWFYSVRDVTISATYTYCGIRQASWPTKIWTGCEVDNDGDQMGGAGVDAVIDNIQYKNGASWVYITTTTVNKNIGSTNPYWVTTANHDPDGHSRIYCHTNAH